MKHYVLALLLLLSGCSASRQFKTHQRTSAISILHWNDFHAQNVPFKVTRKTQSGNDTSYYVGGAATLLGYMNRLRHDRTNVAALNAGDDFQGTPISSITSGRSQIELMNIISPDAVTLGNHEFDYGIDSLRANISRASYPLVCANVVGNSASSTLVPAYMILTVAGTKLGIIGLTPPDLQLLTMNKNLRGLSLRDVDRALGDAVGEPKINYHPNLIIVCNQIGF